MEPGADLNPDIERGYRRPPSVPSRSWSEFHRLTVAGRDESDRSVLLATQVGSRPGVGATSFATLVWCEGHDPLVISDLELPISTTWEFRTSGLWADHVCESPFKHWSYGLEAFALGIDDPQELLGRAMGHRLPLGWEMDFISDADPAFESPVDESVGSYYQRGTVSAELLFVDGSLEIEGLATRSHGWGPHALEALDRGAGGEAAADEVALPTFDGIWWVGRAGRGVTSRYQRPV